MTRIGDIMSSPAVTVDADEPLGRARDIMAALTISHLPVVSQGVLVGMLTEGDVWASKGLDRDEEAQWTDEVPIRRVMRAPVLALDADESVSRAIAILRRRAIGCVPVTCGGELVGIVTRTDAWSAIERDRAATPWNGRAPS
jgi:acetoin utilization protein AcuB